MRLPRVETVEACLVSVCLHTHDAVCMHACVSGHVCVRFLSGAQLCVPLAALGREEQ